MGYDGGEGHGDEIGVMRDKSGQAWTGRHRNNILAGGYGTASVHASSSLVKSKVGVWIRIIRP